MGIKNERDKEPAPPPRWSLADLFPGKDSNEFQQALFSLETESKNFSDTYRGHVVKLSGQKLGDAIEAYEKIAEKAEKIHAFADLTRAVDNAQSAWAQDTLDRLRKSTEVLLFFPLEINAMRESDLLEKIAAPKLASYAPWIGKIRNMREHQLSDAAETYRHKMEPVTEEAWRRLYDQFMIDLRFDLRGEKITEAEIVNIIDSAPSKKLRHEAFNELCNVLGENKKSFALIFNTLADIKAQEDTWRKYDAPEDSRHLDNHIEKETVAALTKTVRESYARTSHRYYAWKAKKAGVARLHPADRNAPLPGDKGRSYTWDEAKEIVLEAYRKVSPEMADIGQRFFDNGWIDAEPREGKDSGGFSHPVTPSSHPYILLNFFGTASDVMTLAHELGHGIHQVMAAEQGFLKSDTPLTLAETASVFGEMLAFQELLSREDDKTVQRNMLAQKIEDMLNTVSRQTAFFTFEQKFHDERRKKGELSPERISEIWQDTQKECLGPAVNLDVKGAENLWMYVPHFVHTPFYVYAYAFGDCLVNALYDAYEKTPDKETFTEKYIDLLKAGGTRRHDAVIAEFGLDSADPQFWKKGLAVIEKYIDKLETLDKELEATQKAGRDFNAAAANDDTPDETISPLKKPGGPKIGGA